MGRRGIQVKVILFDILAMVALVPGQTEDPFFEKRVSSIPQGEPEADHLVSIADAGQAVLIPPIGT
jgi:hypothetical protein